MPLPIQKKKRTNINYGKSFRFWYGAISGIRWPMVKKMLDSSN